MHSCHWYQEKQKCTVLSLGTYQAVCRRYQIGLLTIQSSELL